MKNSIWRLYALSCYMGLNTGELITFGETMSQSIVLESQLVHPNMKSYVWMTYICPTVSIFSSHKHIRRLTINGWINEMLILKDFTDSSNKKDSSHLMSSLSIIYSERERKRGNVNVRGHFFVRTMRRDTLNP